MSLVKESFWVLPRFAALAVYCGCLFAVLSGCSSPPNLPVALTKHARVTGDEAIGYEVDLSFCEINQDLLKIATNLPNLTSLSLSDSQVTDDMLVELANCTSLRTLLLSQTQISNAGLVHLEKLGDLRRLELCSTQITDEGLPQLARLANLQFLSLADTQVTDRGLPSLIKLPLKELSLSGTQITDAGLSALEELTTLESLSLRNMPNIGAGLANRRQLPQLKSLALAYTPLTAADTGTSPDLEGLELAYATTSHADLRELSAAKSLPEPGLQGTRITDEGLAAERVPALENEIKSLFHSRCIKCHGPAKSEGGLDLSNPTGVVRGGESGPAVLPRQLADSPLWERVSSGDMPPDEPLPPAELETLRNWIIAGAPGLPVSKTADGHSGERGRSGEQAQSGEREHSGEHWSFRPLQNPIVPAVRDDSRARTHVDRFIQSKLEEHGLSLGPQTDRATLIRRLSFDLTGLPPTPAEVSAFLQDSRPNAYELLVDHYLASPHYGVRWGRRWLEIAGYADSNGYFDVDSPRHFAYRYRDYAIRSINADKKFDRFVREQLAGDELAGFRPGDDQKFTPEMIELLEATHFLRNGQDGTGESVDNNPREMLHDRKAVLEGAVEILGSALFGVSVQCAKCHDHKFEPVTQREYYGLMAILTPAFNLDHWLKPTDRTVYAALPDEVAAFKRAVKQGTKTEIDRPGQIAAVHDLVAVPPPLYIPADSNSENSGVQAEPAGLQILSDANNPFAIRPSPGTYSSGYRLAFANWLTRPGSRPAALLARLQVNRIWQHYFQRGLSTSPENFGYSGNAPSHPELLEWLTNEFVQSGWSLKSLHRLIVTSEVYRQSSELEPNGFQTDPENHLLWRMPLRRLDAEAIRDALLVVSGDLDTQLGGPASGVIRSEEGEDLIYDTAPGGRRRSIYLQQRRTQMPTLLSVFDAPSLVTNCVTRDVSTIPLQSLALLNSEFVLNRSANLARKLAEAGPENGARIVHAFRLVYGREPDIDEMRESLAFLRGQMKQYDGRDRTPQQSAWTDFSHTLLASNEFLYID